MWKRASFLQFVIMIIMCLSTCTVYHNMENELPCSFIAGIVSSLQQGVISLQWGMLTTFPQRNFGLKFPEIPSQNIISYHWLSVSGNPKIMYCGILFNMTYLFHQFSIPMSVVVLHQPYFTDLIYAVVDWNVHHSAVQCRLSVYLWSAAW